MPTECLKRERIEEAYEKKMDWVALPSHAAALRACFVGLRAEGRD